MGDGRKLAGTEGGADGLRRDVETEIEAHIRMRAEELEAAGMAPDEARSEARRRFGDVDEATRALLATDRRRHRRRWLSEMAEGVRQDLVHAVRQTRRSPGFSALAVAVFALGVGLSTSMFTITDHVLLRPLPFPHSGELVALGSVPEHASPFWRVSMGNWADWRESPTLASTGLYSASSVTVTGRGDAFNLPAAYVRGSFFETLRPRMVLGRPLTEADGQEEATIAVVSEEFWRSVLGADPDVVGTSVDVNGRMVDLVGVVASGQELPDGTGMWMPLAWQPEGGAMRNNINYVALARLAPGVTEERAREELSAIADGIREREPEGLYSWGVGVESLHRFVVGDSTPYLRLLMAAVLFVLLAACANLAGLGLARSRRRAGDMAVRLALGARRGRLLRQLLAEHLVVALVGGGLGVALAWWGTGTMVRVASSFVPRVGTIGFDARIVAFGVSASLVSGILAALLPALRASRSLGYDPTRVVTLDIGLTSAKYRDLNARVAYWQTLMDRERATRGVLEVAVSHGLPTGNGITSFIDVEGSTGASNSGASYRPVSDDYFAVLGIPLRTGRTFSKADDAGTERVGLVNESFARTFWPGQRALGKRFRAPSMEAYYNGGTADWIRVVGVVGDVRESSFETDPRPEVFVLYRQMPQYAGFMTMTAKLGPGAPAATPETLARTARDIDRDQAVEMRRMEDRVHELLSTRRLVLFFVGGFAGAAVLLVSLGIHGLISFAVAERTREIAVRAALGLDRGGILGLMLWGAVRVASLGIAVGLVVGYALSRLLKSMLVDIGAADPVSYVLAAALLLTITLAGALLAALRAARLDPVEALRRE